jgi:DNA-directed RNA polymerase beta' subunit
MDLPPCRYTLGDIAKFTTDKGIPLLNYIPKQEMEAYIRGKITENKDGSLPAWFSIQGTMNERLYFKKEQYLPICAGMLGSAQPQVKAAIIKRWTRLIKDYSSEPAMEKDPEYEKLLKKLTNNANPILLTALEDPKLRWAYEELERALGTVPQDMRLFNRGVLLPFNVLYALRRKDLIADIKYELPVWYSNPFLHAILKFFKNMGKKKSPHSQEEGAEKQAAPGKKYDKMQGSAFRIQSDIVPEGQSADKYLESLEERWCSLRDGDTRTTLILGIKALMKDKLRHTIKLKKLTSIKRDDLSEIAEYLISHNNTLSRLKDQEALRVYMELYMLKLLIR